MFFSKSFGYAVRGILYIALMQNEKNYVQVEEIAARLAAPRHFMGKVLKKLVKEKILKSVKGPSGGFSLTEDTLKIPVMRLIEITEGRSELDNCVLRAKECNSLNPCPMHFQLTEIKTRLIATLSNTRLGDLLTEDKAGFVRSISAATNTPEEEIL